ncbi:MAG: twin-arginine translocase TatA/TatE family subunit [Muribaculaceae bacterium]|nr:twin-arginine translocase TatA/TatE family subunit [Muribaculaceae bacterium]
MTTLNFIGGLGLSEILVIALVVLLFFGGKKIPELMKGLGKGVRSFKDGMKEVQSGLDDEDKEDVKKEADKDKK